MSTTQDAPAANPVSDPAQIAINTLLRRLPALQIHTDTLEWRDTVTIRGLKALPVVF